MNKAINQIQQVLFILLGVFIPTSIAITNFILALLALCWIFEGNFKSKFEHIKSSKWVISVFALIGLYGLGLLWGGNHLNAEWQFQRLALLLIFPVLLSMELKQKTIKRAVIAFLGTAFISALAAILINNKIILPLGNYLSFIEVSWRNSAFITYNYHNVILALATTLSFYILVERKSKYPYLLLLFIAIYTLSIFTERGRAGQVIFNLSAVFYILYYNRKHLLRLVALMLLLFSFQYIIYKSTKVYKNRFDVMSNIIQNNGDAGEGKLEDIRYVFVKESLSRVLEKPLLGYGTGSFGTIFKAEVKSGHYFDKHTTPHNQYLYVWFELGVLGLILLLSIFYHQIKDLFKKQDGIHRILLPLSFMFLMLVDSYFFIFTLTICYIFLYTIYIKYQEE
ncbi:O-antigen ligase family protein [Flavobacteriales bacterium]|jgi:O-antigen ligase|nr:O-antigen ligase family protein [Flavobacteriales bacterium]